MAEDYIIQDRIMRRVRRIYRLRMVFHPAAMKGYAAAALAAAGVSLVSVGSIVQNALTANGPADAAHFAHSALLHTEPSVQLIFLAVLALGFFLVRDILKLSKKPLRGSFA